MRPRVRRALRSAVATLLVGLFAAAVTMASLGHDAIGHADGHSDSPCLVCALGHLDTTGTAPAVEVPPCAVRHAPGDRSEAAALASADPIVAHARGPPAGA